MATDLDLPDLLVAIQTCWCETLQDSVGGAPAACCLIAGEPVVANCCEGFAWVRLVNAYPSTAFPDQEVEAVRCGTGGMAAVVEIGITRCAAQPCDVLDNACCDAEMDMVMVQLDDYARMRKILRCCVGVPGDFVVPGRFTSENKGGCLTSAMQATFRWLDLCGC